MILFFIILILSMILLYLMLEKWIARIYDGDDKHQWIQGIDPYDIQNEDNSETGRGNSAGFSG